MPKARKDSKKKESPENFFDLIVTNSIDFFNASIKDFKKRPKYSVINFCSGLELSLKARLLKEHWSLIVKRPEEAVLLRFQNGDFISVSVDEAIKRLVNACNESFSRDETNCFERLRDHRNKVVHFSHDAYATNPDAKLLEEVATEQCMAWCYLHRRLTGVWFECFKEHQRAIERLNKHLHGHRIFLKAKFLTLKPDIDRESAAGAEYRTCPACGFRSARVDEIHEPVHKVECHVCGIRDSFIRVLCPKCQKPSDIDDMASGSCEDEECETAITLADAMKDYIPRYDPKDQDEPVYYCAACEHHEQSATMLGDRYFCFWCKEWFYTTEQCEYCGEHLVGFDPIGSAFYGCYMCDVAAREHFDKD